MSEKNAGELTFTSTNGVVVKAAFDDTTVDAVRSEGLTLKVGVKSRPRMRVWGWVWKDKRDHNGFYLPCYTPAQHVERGELLALVDPFELELPLENTQWQNTNLADTQEKTMVEQEQARQTRHG